MWLRPLLSRAKRPHCGDEARALAYGGGLVDASLPDEVAHDCGDIAQASSAVAASSGRRRWESLRVSCSTLEELTINYRTPA